MMPKVANWCAAAAALSSTNIRNVWNYWLREREFTDEMKPDRMRWGSSSKDDEARSSSTPGATYRPTGLAFQIKPRASCTSRTWARSERKISAHPPARSPACLPARPPARSGPTSLLFPSLSGKSFRVGSPAAAAAAASIRSYEHATRAIALPNSTLSRTRVARALRFVEPRVLSELYGSGKKNNQKKEY